MPLFSLSLEPGSDTYPYQDPLYRSESCRRRLRKTAAVQGWPLKIVWCFSISCRSTWPDLLKSVTVVMSVTVLSRVITGFVNTVTTMSRVVTGHLLGCHGLSRVLLKLSRECNGNVTEMSQLLLLLLSVSRAPPLTYRRTRMNR